MEGMKLKEQVRLGKLTPQQALDKLKAVEPTLWKQTASAKWLLKHGAI